MNHLRFRRCTLRGVERRRRRRRPSLGVRFNTVSYSDFAANLKFHRFSPTWKGSFSAVSKPIFATKYSFCSIFRDLQDYHSFAPLPIQNFSKISSESFCNFEKFRRKFTIFQNLHRIFADFSMIFKNSNP